MAPHRSGRVGSSPGKCQIPLVFSDLSLISLDLGASGGRRRIPAYSPGTESGSGRLGAEQPTACWRQPLAGRAACETTRHRSPRDSSLSFTLLLPKEFGRGNREQLLESSPSARADPAYSLHPIYPFLMCFVLSCVDLPACKASTPGHL